MLLVLHFSSFSVRSVAVASSRSCSFFFPSAAGRSLRSVANTVAIRCLQRGKKAEAITNSFRVGHPYTVLCVGEEVWYAQCWEWWACIQSLSGAPACTRNGGQEPIGGSWPNGQEKTANQPT